MKKKISAVLAALLLLSTVGCTPASISEPTEVVVSATEATTTTTQATEPFVPREVTVKPASMESLKESAREYLGVNGEIDWEKNLEEGRYGPTIEDEDYLFVFPDELLDKADAEGRIDRRDNIIEFVKLNMYRTKEDDAGLKDGEHAELVITASSFHDIKKEENFVGLLQYSIELGDTGAGLPPEAEYTCETGNGYGIFRAYDRYEFRYIYGENMMVTGHLDIITEDPDNFDKKTLDDIRCFFESLGLRNPLDI